MILTTHESLEELLIRIFERVGAISALDIHKTLASDYSPYALSAVYKELKKLQERGVVIKVKDRYSLSLTWVLNLVTFAERLYARSVDYVDLGGILPAKEKQKSWSFTDLTRMDTFWVQLMFLLFEHSFSKVMFCWIPHFWFHLLHYEHELKAQRAMQKGRYKLFMIIGHDSYLDKLPSKYWSKDVYEWSYAQGPFEDLQNKYIYVIEDYVLEVKLDRKTNAHIDELFSCVKSAQDLTAQELLRVLHSPAKVKIKLERRPKKAATLHKKFEDFWGYCPKVKAE